MPRSAGYSKRSLVDKLGLKPGQRVIFPGAPSGFQKTLGNLPEGLTLENRMSGFFDIIHLFVQSQRELNAGYPGALKHLNRSGALWISWPKKSSGLAGDLNENVLREVLLPRGIVDVKVCAVDQTWSALRFVFRRELRR